MPDASFVDLLIVVAIAFGVPLLLGLAPRLRVPSVILELLAGIVVGPAGFGWVEVTESIRILSIVGLAFLLFLSGLEIDVSKLRGPVLRLAVVGFLLSFAAALAVGFGLDALGLASAPVFVAVVLAATSLGVIVPVLKDANEIDGTFGQLVVAAASIADFMAIILLSVFFARDSTDLSSRLVLIGLFGSALVVAALAATGVRHIELVSGLLVRLQDTTAQIRVRGAFLLMIGFVALAQQLGLEVILGAFGAGVILAIIDRDAVTTHPHFRIKLEGIGFGVFVPIFFVASGLRFDLDALTSDARAIALVPVFLTALLVVRGVPALVYRGVVDGRRTVAAGLLQATSLPFIVAATQIGVELGFVDSSVAAGLLSVLIFPITALTILRERPAPATSAT
jgi:Kef-type K+ transport system membrane component KefB